MKKDAPSGITLYPFKGYEIAPGGQVTKYIMVDGEIVAMKKGPDKFYFHNDHLGGTHIVTNQSGTKVQRNDYAPWGTSSVSEGATPGSQANTEPSHLFTGQERDPETGLYYYGGRYYDPELGRFISPDPFVPSLLGRLDDEAGRKAGA